jgi:hypothetical protein
MFASLHRVLTFAVHTKVFRGDAYGPRVPALRYRFGPSDPAYTRYRKPTSDTTSPTHNTMNKREQKAWVRNFTKSVTDDVNKAITEGRIPDTWGGFELSELFALKFDQESHLRGGVFIGPDGQQEYKRRNRVRRDVKNTYIANNL